MVNEAKKVIARRIRRLMKEHGVEPKDLAEYLSLSLSNIYIILRGEQTLAIEHGKKVAQLLGVTLDQLYDENEEIPIYLTVPKGISREEVEPGVKQAIEDYLKQYEKKEE